MLTIKDIKIIVRRFGPRPENSETGGYKTEELTSILVDQLFEQTNLKSITEVSLVLDVYETTKTEWLKKGLENVLLRGEFPVIIKEVDMGTTNNPTIVPTQPFVWPTSVPPVSVPPVKFEPYCNYKDYKSENLTKVK